MDDRTATHCMVYVTLASKDEAMRIARTLVAERLVACANLLGDVQSVYRWQGKVEEAAEVVMIAKTRRDRVDEALQRINALHSYDTPCAAAYDMTAGLPAYLAWIDTETA